MEEVKVKVRKGNSILEPAEELVGLKTLLKGLNDDDKYAIVKQLVNYKLALIVKPLTDSLGPFNNYNTATKINDRVVKIAFSVNRSQASDNLKRSALINVISNELNIIATEIGRSDFITQNRMMINDYVDTILSMINL